ncbi:MAG: amidohydrolase family protein [Thermoplasmata archaeon]
MSILIKDVLLDGQETDIYVEGNIIAEIGRRQEADQVIDGREKACIPGLINGHTHAAMTLFRSYADDMNLQEWLETKIWPLEAKLRAEDVYWGTKLACLEMIRSGTTTFNDMYFFMEEAARAVLDMGMRAVLSYGIIDLFDDERAAEELKAAEQFIGFVEGLKTERVTAALGPHAIYTVSRGTLEAIRDVAADQELKVHFHLAETEREVEQSKEMYGKSPVRALDEMGFLGEWLVAAHSVWLDGGDARLMGERGVSTVHNPASNMKLSVGKAFPYEELRAAGVTTAMGTDGAASNNNLDMFEAMKLACLLQKFYTRQPTVLRAEDAVRMATEEGAAALDINTGRIEEGKLADIVLVDMLRPEMVPLFNLSNNLAYAASGSVVDTVICDGRVLMRERQVQGEEEILRKAQEVARDVVSR